MKWPLATRQCSVITELGLIFLLVCLVISYFIYIYIKFHFLLGFLFKKKRHFLGLIEHILTHAPSPAPEQYFNYDIYSSGSSFMGQRRPIIFFARDLIFRVILRQFLYHT